jgi:hypothetical protein
VRTTASHSLHTISACSPHNSIQAAATLQIAELRMRNDRSYNALNPGSVTNRAITWTSKRRHAAVAIRTSRIVAVPSGMPRQRRSGSAFTLSV